MGTTACGGTGEQQQGQAETSPTASPEAECAESTVLEMGDSFFEQTCLIVSVDQSLTLRNTGGILHNFQVENVDLDIDLPAGEEANTEPIGQVLEAGTYTFVCKYHPAQMIGELRVT